MHGVARLERSRNPTLPCRKKKKCFQENWLTVLCWKMGVFYELKNVFNINNPSMYKGSCLGNIYVELLIQDRNIYIYIRCPLEGRSNFDERGAQSLSRGSSWRKKRGAPKNEQKIASSLVVPWSWQTSCAFSSSVSEARKDHWLIQINQFRRARPLKPDPSNFTLKRWNNMKP